MNSQTNDYRLADYIGWIRDGSLILRPHYQRGSVWNDGNKSFLIDSVVRGFPIPLIVLQDEISADGRPVRRVVDGQQRLRTLISYADPSALIDYQPDDYFTYTPPEYRSRHHSLTFVDLPQELQKRILKVRLSTVSIEAEGSDKSILEIYDRLNSTGVALNAQELRFAKRSGAFSDACYRLARANQSRWMDWGIFKKTDIVRMREVEFTAELALLITNGIDKTGVSAINNAYEKWSNYFPHQESVEEVFQSTMSALEFAYSYPTKPDPIHPFRSKSWFYTAFAYKLHESGVLDSEFCSTIADDSMSCIESDDITPILLSTTRRIKNRDSLDPDILRAISRSVSDRDARVIRLQFMQSLHDSDDVS